MICNEKYLSQINYKVITTINKVSGIRSKLRYSNTEKLPDIRKDCKADIYLSGPVSKDYFDEELTKKENIQVEWMNYSGYQEYNQLFQPFEHGVSILDLIFNESFVATKVMKSFK